MTCRGIHEDDADPVGGSTTPWIRTGEPQKLRRQGMITELHSALECIEAAVTDFVPAKGSAVQMLITGHTDSRINA